MTIWHRARSLRVALWVVAGVAGLAIVRPWTVRPLHLDKPAAFDAGTYAISLWPRVLDEANRIAADVTSAPATPTSAKARFVKGSGIVTAVDRASRVGLLRVQLAGQTAPGVSIQIGPVIRGTTLRDALSFVQFSDFTNQFDYAGAANALNEHVLRTVVESANVDALQGRTIDFVGAASQTTPPGGPVEVVPVTITVNEAGR
jgi:predicted lipoprotein